MESRVKKWGNSLGVRIPHSLAKEIGIDEDEPIELTVEHGNIVISKSRRYELDDLLAKIIKNNLHDAIETEEPVGREEW